MKRESAAMASALIVCCIWLTAAKAQPVTGSGAEVAWLAPELAAVLDLEAGTQQKVSLRWPRKLPARGYLAVQLNGNETAWVRLANAEAAEHVRFRFLSGTLAAMAAVEAVPQRRSPVDFVFTAPLGSPIWLGLSVRPGQPFVGSYGKSRRRSGRRACARTRRLLPIWSRGRRWPS